MFSSKNGENPKVIYLFAFLSKADMTPKFIPSIYMLDVWMDEYEKFKITFLSMPWSTQFRMCEMMIYDHDDKKFSLEDH